LLLASLAMHSLKTDQTARMSPPGVTQFQNLSTEKQALAMFQILEENRRMLRLILASEISSGSSSFSEQPYDQAKPFLKHRNNQQSEEDKPATVQINVGGKKHKVKPLIITLS
jgi:hypothetical protein